MNQNGNGRESETQAPEAAAGEQAELQGRIDEQARRIDELTRAYAELINDRDAFRQRLERERERQVEGAKAEVAGALFEAIDDLRLALSNAGPEAAGALVDGVRMIAEGIQRRTLAMGLEPIPARGIRFDPNLHEAIDLVPTAEREQDGTVIEELRGGWRMGERVVRAARVRVARYVPPAGE